jgi:hypothetical protein
MILTYLNDSLLLQGKENTLSFFKLMIRLYS